MNGLNTKKLRVVLSGGGTGGHLFPAVAIANKIRQLYEDSEIVFVGAKGKIEMERVPKEGYKIYGLWISGFQRTDLLKNFTLPLKLVFSFLKAKKIISTFKPHIAIGTGGYASFPLLYAAAQARIPTLIQEQNFFPGISNKLLAKKVNRVCTVFSGMERYFPSDKIIITGNPVREEINPNTVNIVQSYKKFNLEETKKTLLVLGGSLGARTLNESMLRAYKYFLQMGIQIIWQTGRSFETKRLEENLISQKGFWISPFIENMAAAYSVADLVVSRAGAITLSELSLMGKAVILIPSPNVTEDHQTKNALSLVNENAAILIKDSEALDEFEKTVMATIHDENKLNILRTNIKMFAKPDAVSMIVNEIMALVKK